MSTELNDAYNLIKSGQRQAAGQLLRTYLAAHPRDVDGWWLMAHTVSKPENVIKCLETVLKLDPNHPKARERLARLQGASPAMSGAPQTAIPTPVVAPAALSAPAAFPPAPETPDVPAFDPFANTDTAGDPFANLNADAPSFFAQLGTAQPPGSGSQPEWGPGLAFVKETPAAPDQGRARLPRPKSAAPPDFVAARDNVRQGMDVEKVIGVFVIAAAVIVLIGLAVWLGSSNRLFKTKTDSKDAIPAMATLDDVQFSIQYPAGWDARCTREANGYQVCGIANHSFYNEVDYYSAEGANIGALLAEGFSLAFTGEDIPATSVSIIAMDVPTTSASYYSYSVAKSKYDWTQQGWDFYGQPDEVVYETKEITVDGQKAYYYKFVSNDRNFPNASYDVYIQRSNGMMFWMTVSVYGRMEDEFSEATLDAMIDSIHLKPPEEWSGGS